MRKLVIVTSRFPLPMVGGFEIKNYHLIAQLARNYELSVHFIQRGLPSDIDVQSIRQYCRVHIYQPNVVSVFARMFINLFVGRPLQNALYYSNRAAKAISSDLADADAAICSVIRTCEYIQGFKGPKFFDLADSLGQLYLNNLKTASGWQKLAYRIEASRLLSMERRLVDVAAGVFFFNNVEASYYRDAPNVHVLPHGVSDEVFDHVYSDPLYADGLSFIGKLDVAHNIDMVLWFINKVMPHLPENIKLYLIGSNPASKLKTIAKKDPRVIFTGFLDNPYRVLHSSIASICPLQTGGGIQNKVIESLACGTITIASPKAILPFLHSEESGIIVCDKPSEWVKTIGELLVNSSEYKHLREMGQCYAKKHFSWTTYGDVLSWHIKHAIN